MTSPKEMSAISRIRIYLTWEKENEPSRAAQGGQANLDLGMLRSIALNHLY